jgi:CheY-like chemotaxis protein
MDDGYNVVAAEHGLDAINRLGELHPDLVICDVMMPILDGGHVANIIRATPDLEAVPVVGVTALSRLRRACDSSFDAVIRKPFDVAELLETVATLLSSPQPAPRF